MVYGYVSTCDSQLVYGGLTTASVYTWPTNTEQSVEHATSVLATHKEDMYWPDTFAFGTDVLTLH